MTSLYEQFVNNSYSGRMLLQKHSLYETGTWQIYGEDPNCDLDEPFLCVLSGRLQDVIIYAVELKGFWNLGAGGRIEKINVINVTAESAANRIKTLKRINDLEAELKQLKDSL